MLKKTLFFVAMLSTVFVASALTSKPIVWIISDGCDTSLRTSSQPSKPITDPDDIPAIASYLLMSNHFDTKGIVVASNGTISSIPDAQDQAEWARGYFGAAYQADLEALNREIGGYQSEIPFYTSALAKRGGGFNPSKSYKSLKEYPSIAALYDVVKSSKDVVNILCWGKMTEQAIFVRHCKSNGRRDLLEKVRFISHWTASYIRVGTEEHPEHVHNCFNDASACAYLKNEAMNGTIKFYECGSIGETGVVEGGHIGLEYYEQFKSSELGRIYAEGKFVEWKGWVDNSDSATFWALLGDWGVSLSDLASNGTLTSKMENRNRESFLESAKLMQRELLRRSRVAAGAVANPIYLENLFPSHGLTDPHVWIEGDRIYLVGGHDQSWLTDDTWKMDRWEIWSSTNLLNWHHESDILPTDTYIGDAPNCWAGDLVGRDGKFYWYFSNRHTDSGVMVSDRVGGGYKDALGEPLLPKGIIPGNPYDPEIFVEDGRYYVIFSAGKYFISELADDMISLAHPPKQIIVEDKDGSLRRTDDKSCTFKRDGIYYLVWGDDYATADNIYGPYTYQGAFLSGGHSSVFEWDGQWYVVQENKDISLFYRGISLKPIYFDKDGLVVVPTDDFDYPGIGRRYDFDVSEMGWRVTCGEPLTWSSKSGTISGKLSADGSTLQSAVWLLNDCKKLSRVRITMKNLSDATEAKVSIASYNSGNAFWTTPEIEWCDEWSKSFALKPSSAGSVEYIVEFDAQELKSFLKAIQIEPALSKSEGEWEISQIIIE